MINSVPQRRLVSVLMTSLMLFACSSETSSSLQTSAAPQSAAIALNLLFTNGGRKAGGSSPALMSVYVSAFMAHGPGTYAAATNGANIQAAMQKPSGSTEQVYLVLQELGAALQVNVADLLNRSTNRRQTLDDYTKTLNTLVIESNRQVAGLEQQADTLKDRHSEERRVSTQIQRDLSKALRAKDYSTAARKQEELQPAEMKLKSTEVEQDEAENILSIYEDLLELAASRLDAIDKNREILVAGQKVIDVPGIDDLGVLQRNRKGRLGL